MKYLKISLGVVVAGIIVCAAAFFLYERLVKKEAGQTAQEKGLISWREDFTTDAVVGDNVLLKGWRQVGKPGTQLAEFSVGTDAKDEDPFLHVRADNASGNLIAACDGVDITKTPILRWSWRATTLPWGADGRVRSKDDQALGIYVGTGSPLSNKSVSYRWDTQTPRGAEGSCIYGMGVVRVKWFTLRNQEDVKGDRWLIEERNVAEDFKKAWGFYPEKVYVSISSNSQYTGTSAVADLGWIEFTSLPDRI